MNVEEQQYAAARALFARVLADEVAAEVAKARALLEPTMRPGARVPAVLPDGREIGAVTKSKRTTSAAVTDADALLDYVRRTRPDEVITTHTIRSSYLTWLLGDAKAQLTNPDNTDGLVVDGAGEVVPGISLVHGGSSYRPDVTAEGRAAVRQVLAELLGRELSEALALPQPAGDAP